MNMQLMTLDMNSLPPPQKLNTRKVGSQDNGFSFVLDQSREKQELPTKTNLEKKENLTKTESKPLTSDTKKTQEPKKPIQVSKEDELSAKDKNDKTIQAIADLLDITTDELEQILGVLQIGLSDLLQKDHLQQLMMAVHKVEEPMDLLTIPGIISDIKGIAVILENQALVPEVKTIQVETSQTPLQINSGQEEQVETGLRAQVQGQNPVAQKNLKAGQESEENSDGKTLDVDSAEGVKPHILAATDEGLAQSQEQFTPNQNNTSNEFLNNLSQSLSEAFQSQNGQIVDASKTQGARNPIVDPRMVLDQVVEKIKASALDQNAQMSIQLKPEHLGKLSMEIISKQGIMTAQFIVENEKTKQMLEQNIQNLRESLEDKGLVIEQLEVTVGQNQNDKQQAYQGSKLKRNTSEIINQLMNEEILEEESQPDKKFESDTSEVDYIA